MWTMIRNWPVGETDLMTSEAGKSSRNCRVFGEDPLNIRDVKLGLVFADVSSVTAGSSSNYVGGSAIKRTNN